MKFDSLSWRIWYLENKGIIIAFSLLALAMVVMSLFAFLNSNSGELQQDFAKVKSITLSESQFQASTSLLSLKTCGGKLASYQVNDSYIPEKDEVVKIDFRRTQLTNGISIVNLYQTDKPITDFEKICADKGESL